MFKKIPGLGTFCTQSVNVGLTGKPMPVLLRQYIFCPPSVCEEIEGSNLLCLESLVFPLSFINKSTPDE
jgi:hypothetical protein